MRIIRAWSGPRNLSTALMRSWENRPDTEVLDEPLYAHYLHVTGLDHPGRNDILAAGPVDEAEAVRRCTEPALGDGISVSYQKHMAHHLVEGMDLGWIGEASNLLLVRHPRRVIASYLKVRDRPTLTDLGLEQQSQLMERFGPLPVVDADIFLRDPESGLGAMCSYAGVDFDPAMLTWPVGTRESDGAWAPFWYGAVERSRGFSPAPADDPAMVPLPDAFDRLAHEAQRIYDDLLAASA